VRQSTLVSSSAAPHAHASSTKPQSPQYHSPHSSHRYSDSAPEEPASKVSSDEDPELSGCSPDAGGVDADESDSMRRRRRTGTQIGDDGTVEPNSPRSGVSGAPDSASDSESDSEMTRRRWRVPSSEKTGIGLSARVVRARQILQHRGAVPVLAPGIDGVYPAPANRENDRTTPPNGTPALRLAQPNGLGKPGR
jgi:hypothetical protein